MSKESKRVENVYLTEEEIKYSEFSNRCEEDMMQKMRETGSIIQSLISKVAVLSDQEYRENLLSLFETILKEEEKLQDEIASKFNGSYKGISGLSPAKFASLTSSMNNSIHNRALFIYREPKLDQKIGTDLETLENLIIEKYLELLESHQVKIVGINIKFLATNTPLQNQQEYRLPAPEIMVESQLQFFKKLYLEAKKRNINIGIIQHKDDTDKYHPVLEVIKFLENALEIKNEDGLFTYQNNEEKLAIYQNMIEYLDDDLENINQIAIHDNLQIKPEQRQIFDSASVARVDVGALLRYQIQKIIVNPNNYFVNNVKEIAPPASSPNVRTDLHQSSSISSSSNSKTT